MSQDKSKNENLQGDANAPPTYKQQLDEAAMKVKYSQDGANEGGVVGQVVEKVSQYVPTVGKVLGKEPKEDPASREKTEAKEPRKRLYFRDTEIEEFLKAQHSSRKDDGTLT
ncbi:hypothetical protein DHEL01_v202181 [Diaporthe helianthi]|uniref:Uncharacterized protein n=1 Tax=Diaporthe helianthi TaxID=158607 RepID=A0A2P5IA94_DIAHE|nr:hypothetical protein DHEL01_v202181 [Diaporthe helianthi]